MYVESIDNIYWIIKPSTYYILHFYYPTMEGWNKLASRSKLEKINSQTNDRLKRRDDEYKNMLSRFFSLKHQQEPESPQLRVETPDRLDVRRTCKGKTCWGNFTDYSAWLNREPKHISDYFKAELRGNTVMKDCRLTLDGKHSETSLGENLNRYIKAYVRCESCCSLATVLNKNSRTRLFEVKCSVCGSCRNARTIKQVSVNI